MTGVEHYALAASVDEALGLLAEWGGQARVIAGGTDLVIDLVEGRKKSRCLVDVAGIAGMRGVTAHTHGGIAIGAATLHADAAASDLIRRQATVLAEAAACMGSPQIRNQGTIGGNLVSAQPAADAAVALAALDATVEIAGPSRDQRRTVSWADLYTGKVGLSRVDATKELVTTVFLASDAAGTGSSFQRLAKRQALSLPILNCAVVLGVRSGFIEWGRIAMGPVAEMPFRCAEAEEVLCGLAVDDEAGLRRAAAAVTGQVCPRDSCLRGSNAYRCAVAGNLAYRGLQVALERSRQAMSPAEGLKHHDTEVTLDD